MKHYKLKLTALTPIHIGTGEDFDPTNFVIDGNYLYEFDETAFFKNLDGKGKQVFLQAVDSKAADALFGIHRVIKNYKQAAIDSATLKVQVSKGVAKAYENKVGRVVQQEGGRRINPRKVFNQFQIQRTMRQPNTNHPYIPGSSLKGAISTAFQEMLFKQNPALRERFFETRNPTHRLFKNLLVSDVKATKIYAMVGYALNKERFEEDDQGPKTMLEAIYADEKVQSIFDVNVSTRDYLIDPDRPKQTYPIDIETIRQACNAHYLPLFEQMFEPYTIFKGQKIDDFTNEYFSEAFYNRYKDFKLKDNQFLIRVGRHSQARAVTIDGMRKIRVKVSGGGPKRKPNRWETLDQETTTWFFGRSEYSNENLLPFGWVLCEVVEEKYYQKDSL